MCKPSACSIRPLHSLCYVYLLSLCESYLETMTAFRDLLAALEKVGEIKAGEKVLVTAAAGGTGQFAVQLAKIKGCHVVATCGGEAKARLLRSLGADRVIDYTSESVPEVLKREYGNGVDCVYESVVSGRATSDSRAACGTGREQWATAEWCAAQIVSACPAGWGDVRHVCQCAGGWWPRHRHRDDVQVWRRMAHRRPQGATREDAGQVRVHSRLLPAAFHQGDDALHHSACCTPSSKPIAFRHGSHADRLHSHSLQFFRSHVSMLSDLLEGGKLRVHVDDTKFVGVEDVNAAVQHLQSGRSAGKVVVQMAKTLPPGIAAPAFSRL